MIWGPYTPRVWQADALPVLIEALRRGERPVLSAVMGAGKSILLSALVATALERTGDDAVIVTAPSEMLVTQLAATLATVCGPKNVGVYYGRKKQARRRVIVACNPSLANLTIELAAQERRCRLLIVDECHRSECQSVRDVVPVLRPSSMLGVTATPYRSAEVEALSLYTSVAYRYTWGDARRDGVLVRRVDVWDENADERTDLDTQCLALIREHASGPGIISARTIDDAEGYAEWLRARGYLCEAIHSKLAATERTDRIERLRTGELAALVHVSMLAEGVDFPWLRWLCLRRPVGARVRLVQEIGRGARAFEGKDHYVCIDPHNLIGVHGLTHPEAIGEALEEEAAAEEARGSGEATEDVVVDGPLPPGPTVDVSTQWAQRLLLSMQEEGLAKPSVQVGRWRSYPPKDRQLAALDKMGRAWSRYLPDEHRHAVLAMSRPSVAPQLQRGAASDLLSVLFAVAEAAPDGSWEARKGWRFPWPEHLVVEPLQSAAMKGLAKIRRAGK